MSKCSGLMGSFELSTYGFEFFIPLRVCDNNLSDHPATSYTLKDMIYIYTLELNYIGSIPMNTYRKPFCNISIAFSLFLR